MANHMTLTCDLSTTWEEKYYFRKYWITPQFYRHMANLISYFHNARWIEASVNDDEWHLRRWHYLISYFQQRENSTVVVANHETAAGTSLNECFSFTYFYLWVVWHVAVAVTHWGSGSHPPEEVGVGGCVVTQSVSGRELRGVCMINARRPSLGRRHIARAATLHQCLPILL